MINKIFLVISEKILFLKRWLGAYVRILKRKKIYKNVILTKEQKKEIANYYKENYGKPISDKWHRLYTAYTGNFDIKYFPDILFSSKLEFKLNNRNVCKVLADKALSELLYSNVDGLFFAKSIIYNCSGIFYDKDRNILTLERVLKILKNQEKILIKATLGSASGLSVRVFNFVEKNDEEIIKILEDYNNNYVIQELLINCKDISCIYGNSINTIRVITYIINGKLYHCPLTLRMGRNGKVVDNICSGGLSIGINEDGSLKEYAYSDDCVKFSKHPDTDFVFKNHRIPYIDKIVKIAYECHRRTPHLKIISWDFTIDDLNHIVLLEANMNYQTIWFPQYANGVSIFGDNTEYMLKLISNKKRGKNF